METSSGDELKKAGINLIVGTLLPIVGSSVIILNPTLWPALVGIGVVSLVCYISAGSDLISSWKEIK
jgi:hypothetical protein